MPWLHDPETIGGWFAVTLMVVCFGSFVAMVLL